LIMTPDLNAALKSFCIMSNLDANVPHKVNDFSYPEVPHHETQPWAKTFVNKFTTDKKGWQMDRHVTYGQLCHVEVVKWRVVTMTGSIHKITFTNAQGQTETFQVNVPILPLDAKGYGRRFYVENKVEDYSARVIVSEFVQGLGKRLRGDNDIGPPAKLGARVDPFTGNVKAGFTTNGRHFEVFSCHYFRLGNQRYFPEGSRPPALSKLFLALNWTCSDPTFSPYNDLFAADNPDGLFLVKDVFEKERCPICFAAGKDGSVSSFPIMVYIGDYSSRGLANWETFVGHDAVCY